MLSLTAVFSAHLKDFYIMVFSMIPLLRRTRWWINELKDLMGILQVQLCISLILFCSKFLLSHVPARVCISEGVTLTAIFQIDSSVGGLPSAQGVRRVGQTLHSTSHHHIPGFYLGLRHIPSTLSRCFLVYLFVKTWFE